MLSSNNAYDRPTAANVPLDPGKACDAHIRKYDDRGGRDTWTHYYHNVVTSYVADPNELMTTAFTEAYSTAQDPFAPADIRYVNWRLRMNNDTDAVPAVSPSIDGLTLAWRLVRQP